MTNRPRFVFACVLAMFSGSGLTTAHAADPAFCKQYARAALNQVRGGLANPSCAAGLQGARWSTDFAIHYEWCLGAAPEAGGAEKDVRAQQLRACTGR